MPFKQIHYIILIFMISSCSFMRKSPKSAFNDGFYKQKIQGEKVKVYIDIENDLLTVHPTKKVNKKYEVDTSLKSLTYPLQINTTNLMDMSFNNNSLDLDFLVIPIKLRLAQKGVPNQFNANLNGAFYLGLRTDKYLVSYEKNPLGINDRVINHFGFSFGLLSGLGNSVINPTNTNNFLTLEYDGIILTNGIAGIIAVNNFTIGVAFGFDNLLDKNKTNWIYENKPWVGLTFGLNLN